MSPDSSCPRRSPGRYISHIQMGARSFFSRELEPFGLGQGQFHFLFALYRNDGILQETLTEMMMVDKATTTRAIKKLESQGYVRRERDPEDQRRYMVSLTERAWDVKPRIREVMERWTSMLLRDFNEDEIDQLFDFLDRLEKNSGGVQ